MGKYKYHRFIAIVNLFCFRYAKLQNVPAATDHRRVSQDDCTELRK